MYRHQISRVYWYIKYFFAKKSARNKSITRLKKTSPLKILVLCYGNIYRSPFVAEYLRNKLPGEVPYQIRSAGFFPKSGRKSDEKYVELVKKYSIDLEDHESEVVDNVMLEWADAIIIMDGKNFKLSLLQNPAIESKLIWLGSLYKKLPIEIPDPYSKNIEQQKTIIDQMILSSDAFIEQLQIIRFI